MSETYEELLATLDGLADRLGTVLADAERLAGPETWIGPAAEDSLQAVGFAARGLGEAAVAVRTLVARTRADLAARDGPS